MKHVQKVIRSGGGLFAYVPAALARELGIGKGDAFVSTVREGVLIAQPVTLDAQTLVERLHENNQHAGDGSCQEP